MSNRKKLWSIFGPLIVAILMVMVVFLLPWKFNNTPAIEQKAADSLSATVFKNRNLKVAALSDKKANYVPFFGSSELARMDLFHPSVMAARYHDYKPFLFGSRGTQSLPQLFNTAMMNKQLKNRKAVYIISPQWFVKQGVSPQAFKYYNGNYADYMWLEQANPKSPYDRYTASRLVILLNDQGFVSSLAYKIASGEALSAANRANLKVRLTFLSHEDQLFSGFFLNNNYGNKIAPQITQLPRQYNYQKLMTMAKQMHAEQSTNNQFGILNPFYSKRLKKSVKNLKGAQKNFTYLQSPEYNDLEVVLKQFQKNNTDVIFMITPVNTKWEKYTGMSMKMYEQTVKKIKFQLQSQGFNNILDYSKDGAKKGFMQDTIHLGWAGWVKFDHQVSAFIENKQPAPNYKLNDAFLSTRWANLKPSTTNLDNFEQNYLK